MGCFQVEEAVIRGKEIRVCSPKRDNSGIGVITFEENLVRIGLIMAEIFFMKCDLDLHFQGQLMVRVCCQPQKYHFGESLVNIDCIIAWI